MTPLWTVRDAAHSAYDAAARALPDCAHNDAWWREGPGRPPPPDCEHNRPWRERIAAAWAAFTAAIDAEEARDGA